MNFDKTIERVTKYGKAFTVFVTVAGIIITGFLYYMPRSTAEEQHQAIVTNAQSDAQMYAQVAEQARIVLAEYDEMGRLETDIKIKQLEIKQINGTSERRVLTPDEETTLELARTTLSLLQERLRDLQTQIRENQV